MDEFVSALFEVAGRFVAWMLLIWFVWQLLLPHPHDDSDPPGQRSGMVVLTDHRTGCQYLGYIAGIVPRVDAAGRHVGCAR